MQSKVLEFYINYVFGHDRIVGKENISRKCHKDHLEGSIVANVKEVRIKRSADVLPSASHTSGDLMSLSCDSTSMLYRPHKLNLEGANLRPLQLKQWKT